MAFKRQSRCSELENNRNPNFICRTSSFFSGISISDEQSFGLLGRGGRSARFHGIDLSEVQDVEKNVSGLQVCLLSFFLFIFSQLTLQKDKVTRALVSLFSFRSNVWMEVKRRHQPLIKSFTGLDRNKWVTALEGMKEKNVQGPVAI